MTQLETLHVKGRRYPYEMPENIECLGDGSNYAIEVNMRNALEGFQWRRRSAGYGPERTGRDMLRLVEDCLRITRLCESPIEQEIVPWLLCEDYGDLGDGTGHAHIIGVDKKLPSDLAIIPQMSFGRFRLDFMIVASYRGNRKMIALECDGHDFHVGNCQERRDFDRDAYLLQWGIETVRATGSEIKAIPHKITKYVASRFLDWGIEFGMPVLTPRQENAP